MDKMTILVENSVVNPVNPECCSDEATASLPTQPPRVNQSGRGLQSAQRRWLICAKVTQACSAPRLETIGIQAERDFADLVLGVGVLAKSYFPIVEGPRLSL